MLRISWLNKVWLHSLQRLGVTLSTLQLALLHLLCRAVRQALTRVLRTPSGASAVSGVENCRKGGGQKKNPSWNVIEGLLNVLKQWQSCWTPQGVVYLAWAAACSSCCLTVLWRCAGRQAAALDLLPPQPNSLFELLNLRVAVAFFIGLFLLPPHVVLHQLNGGNEWLRNAEVGILLHWADCNSMRRWREVCALMKVLVASVREKDEEETTTFSRSAQLPKSCSDR